MIDIFKGRTLSSDRAWEQENLWNIKAKILPWAVSWGTKRGTAVERACSVRISVLSGPAWEKCHSDSGTKDLSVWMCDQQNYFQLTFPFPLSRKDKDICYLQLTITGTLNSPTIIIILAEHRVQPKSVHGYQSYD